MDAQYRTGQPHIFAVGAVIGFPQLASVSMEQGRLAVCNAYGVEGSSDPGTYPYGIYTIPEISFVGKTEEQLTDTVFNYPTLAACYQAAAFKGLNKLSRWANQTKRVSTWGRHTLRCRCVCLGFLYIATARSRSASQRIYFLRRNDSVAMRTATMP